MAETKLKTQAVTDANITDAKVAATIAKYADGRFKIGTINRDQTAASGDVGYTGVGFTPKAVLFFSNPGVIDGTHYSSWGLDDATSHVCSLFRTGVNTNLGTSSIFCGNGASDQKAIVKTMDADGFTLTWTKDGTPPAGTMVVYYLAFR